MNTKAILFASLALAMIIAGCTGIPQQTNNNNGGGGGGGNADPIMGSCRDVDGARCMDGCARQRTVHGYQCAGGGKCCLK